MDVINFLFLADLTPMKTTQYRSNSMQEMLLLRNLKTIKRLSHIMNFVFLVLTFLSLYMIYSEKLSIFYIIPFCMLFCKLGIYFLLSKLKLKLEKKVTENELSI